MKKLLLIILIISSVPAYSQVLREHALQVSGVVVASDSLYPVPFCTVYRGLDHRGSYSDYNGYFTLPAFAGDTLFFSCIGLKKSFYVIPNDTTQAHISVVQWMQLDEVLLPTVNILPYPTRDQLRGQLMALDLPGDRYYRFNRNQVSLMALDGLNDLTSDRALSQAGAEVEARYNHGFRSGGNLLDPVAWGRFMRALRKGDKDLE